MYATAVQEIKVSQMCTAGSLDCFILGEEENIWQGFRILSDMNKL